ncbi:MAG TPA: Gfo/Idh/MocA family oxidoreductase [Candidatus Sumerlaeota bacterium]|nr:Gfo/Idh/MocA family oxidoreductase [Candidatus Sumerlaeota bacterium]
MIKLGVVTVMPHGEPWAEVLRRYYPQCELTAVWDYDPEVAAKFAKDYGVGRVVERVEDMVDLVDAALIPGGRVPPRAKQGVEAYIMDWVEVGPSDHLRLAEPFLKAGKPVNVDKPFADSVTEAQTMIDLSRRHRAPLMSTSAIRYSPQVVSLKEIIDAGACGLGDPRTAVLIMGGAPLYWYGIHGLEALYTVFGPGVEYVLCDEACRYYGPGNPDAWSGIIKWADQKLGMLHLVRDVPAEKKEPLWPTTYVLPDFLGVYYQLRVFGTTGVTDIDVKGKTYYTRMLGEFIKMIETGREPIPLEQTLEVTRILLALQQAARTGGRVYAKDIK